MACVKEELKEVNGQAIYSPVGRAVYSAVYWAVDWAVGRVVYKGVSDVVSKNSLRFSLTPTIVEGVVFSSGSKNDE